MKDKIIYSISTEDIYNVARESLYKKPSSKEIQFVEDNIGNRILWFDIISQLLHESQENVERGTR